MCQCHENYLYFFFDTSAREVSSGFRASKCWQNDRAVVDFELREDWIFRNMKSCSETVQTSDIKTSRGSDAVNNNGTQVSHFAQRKAFSSVGVFPSTENFCNYLIRLLFPSHRNTVVTWKENRFNKSSRLKLHGNKMITRNSSVLKRCR